MKAILYIANILRRSKQRQFAVFCEILYVICDNDITATSKGALILKHIFKILARLVNGSTELFFIHRNNKHKIQTIKIFLKKNFQSKLNGYSFLIYINHQIN